MIKRCVDCYNCVGVVAVADEPAGTKLTASKYFRCKMGHWRDGEGREITIGTLEKLENNEMLDSVYAEGCEDYDG